MVVETIESIFRLRRDTAATWASVNPILALGEPGLETDTRKVKYGDGSTAWNTLAYSAGADYSVDTDGTLAANSDTRIASQKATKTYVDAAVTGVLKFTGSTDCSTNPNYPAATKGASYVVTVAGKIGGASGISVDIGDVYFATANNAGGTQAAVGASWRILEHNLLGALLSANNLSDLASPSAARTNLGLAAIAASGSASDLSSGTVPAARMPAITGDITTVAGAVAATLAAVNSAPGTFGSASQSLTATVDAKGRITSLIAQTIAAAWASITGKPTTIAGYGITDAINSSALDTDGTLAANSDTRIATQKATKTYVDQIIAAQDAMVFKNVIDCSTNPNYPAADRGHTYRVSVAGKIGGASGVNVEIGDIIICLTDGTAAGNQATVGANWGIIQANLDGAVIGPSSAADASVAGYNGATGKLIKQLSSAEIRAAADFTSATAKATPVDADEVPLVDSAASNILKKLTWANLKATLKTYFDTLYQAIDTIAWTDYTSTCTLTAGAGAFNVASVIVARYKKIGKTVHVRISVQITDNGTANSYFTVTAPFASPNVNVNSFQPIYCTTTFAAGIAGRAALDNNSTIIYVTKYDGTYLGQNSLLIHLCGSYEAA